MSEVAAVPKVSVYLPDELYRRVRDSDLSLSAVTQAALERELALRDNDRWLDAMTTRPVRVVGAVDVSRLLDDVRDEFGA